MISYIQLGLVPYAQGLELQRKLVAARKAGEIGDVLLLLEHPAVITLGKNADRKNVLASREQLAQKGVALFDCDRGGDVTYHGPGQLVGYPIFDLRQLGVWPVDFMRKLEEVLIRACADFGLLTTRVQGLTGVWTRPLKGMQEAGQQESGARFVPKKLAAMGIHVSRGVTSHGFAFNVTSDLEHFRLIVPCGIADKPVTSLNAELQSRHPNRTVAPPTVAEAAEYVVRNFGLVFGQAMQEVATVDELLGAKVGVPAKAPKELREMREEDTYLA
ncbi:MAG TPA: lipoyl(octanoyl) transferase LipB [Terriglobales bacterium]|nr:lipoyl(octanoyl) transferase LipB [Terriglobales bacterium]